MKIVNTLKRDEIVGQICDLINKYNGWARRFTPARLNTTNAVYAVEMVGNLVVGVGGLKKLNDAQSEFMHLCVRPEFRRLGIASRLSKRRLELLNTPIVISHIRSDNIPSISNSLKTGFVPVKAVLKGEYSLLTFARFKDENSNAVLRNILKEALNGTIHTECYNTT